MQGAMYDNPQPRIKGHILYIFVTIAISSALLLVSRRLPGFGEWYARQVFPVFPNSLGRLASFAPFSVFEFLLLGLAASLPLVLSGVAIVNVIRRKRWVERPKRMAFSRRALGVCCLFSTLFLLYVLTCGVNFNRNTFAAQAGLETSELTEAELRQVYRLLVGEINEINEINEIMETSEIAKPGGGRSLPDTGAMHQHAIEEMEALSQAYPGLISYYPKAKPVYFSEVLSHCQLGGFYSCFTMEANYNRYMPSTSIPFTICHELAHVSGFAREDEANFISYLACSQSTDPLFRYSGCTYALRYTLSALRSKLESREYLRLCEHLPEWVWQDLYETRLYWDAYEGKLADVYQSYNNSFLKANHQEDGVESYGRMLYLMLAYYREAGRLAHYSPDPEPILAQVSALGQELFCPYAIMADRETGAVLYAKDSSARAEPASVTKIITAITAIELIDDMDAKVTMKTRDFTDLYRLGASLSGFKVGEAVSYRDLLYTLMLISGCDSAYALANNLCGSLPAFAEKMNERADSLGLSDSHFVDPSGLTAPDHYTSAEDTVKILDYALKNPVFREIFETASYEIPPTNLTPEERVINSYFFSRLERDYTNGYLENGVSVIGGKTGFTNAAGLCLATVGAFDGREYIVVVFGGPGTNRTPQYNFMDAVELFLSLRSRQFTSRTY